jgi:hypothetical protein
MKLRVGADELCRVRAETAKRLSTWGIPEKRTAGAKQTPSLDHCPRTLLKSKGVKTSFSSE